MKPKRVFTDEQKAALQNALCKCSLIRYLARDMNGALWGYSHKPEKTHDGWVCKGGGNTSIYLNPSISSTFPQITWEDKEPTSCEEILGELKLIEEMAQAMSDFELEDTANCDMELSRHLFAKGYRKQSDTAREIVERLYKQTHNYYPSIDHYCLSKRVILVKDLEELAKEYGVNPEEV